jgi:hypothetical protein
MGFERSGGGGGGGGALEKAAQGAVELGGSSSQFIQFPGIEPLSILRPFLGFNPDGGSLPGGNVQWYNTQATAYDIDGYLHWSSGDQTWEMNVRNDSGSRVDIGYVILRVV